MKKHLSILLIMAIAFGAVFTLASCDDPTFGLEKVSFEDIAKAKLYDKYNVSTRLRRCICKQRFF